MNSFIEGAAYVSPSRNQLYLCEQHSDEAALILHSVGRWEYAKIGNPKIPDDLVLIWAPGDESPTRVIRDPKNPGTVRLDPPVALKAGDTFYPSAIHRGVPIHTPYNATHVHGLPATHPFGGTLISSKDVPQETVMRIFESATNDDPVVKYDPDGTLVYQHPKTRGWFYPTRYNETPGLYEDELENPEGFGNRWEYRDADPSGYGDAAKSWLEVDTGTWHAVPNDGASAVAVRWRCKLDA